MLPKAVLPAPARGGKKRNHQIEKDIRSRCQAWLEGNRAGLWLDTHNVRKRSEVRLAFDNDDKRAERALEFMRDDLLQKACSALFFEAPVHVTDAVRAEMASKHPAASPAAAAKCAALREVHSSAAEVTDVDSLMEAMSSFPKGSAAGPSGLRPQHVRDALVPGRADEV